MSATITRSLDLRELPNGSELATTAVAMLSLRPGESLEVLTRDPRLTREVAVWSRAVGHRLVRHTVDRGVHHIVIERSEHP